MEIKITKQFTQEILDEALKRYGINQLNIHRISGFESFFFECRDKNILLRITHNTHRTESAILAEIEFIKFLSHNKINVPEVILSKKNNSVEIVGRGKSNFFIVAFNKISGKSKNVNLYDNNLIFEYGRLIGKIHNLSKDYKPKKKRCSWSTSDYYKIENLPKDHKEVINKSNQLIKYLKDLPKSNNSYGLIHNDAHTGNILISNRVFNLIDFDDCMYSWYISDIAIIIFNAIVFNSDLLDNSNKKKIKFINNFLTLFMKGYRKENNLNQKWMKEIPHFLKLQELSLYLTIYKSDLDISEKGDPFVRNFMNKRKENLEKGLEFININFNKF